jgi:8-oxo-dGTP diphosphatase
VSDPEVRAVCGVLALDDRGNVLLIRRSDDRSWGLPGGGVEPGETWTEAALRECREETGWEVTVTGLWGVYSDPSTQVHGYPDGRRVHFFGAVFLASAESCVQDRGAEVAEVAFFARDDLPSPLFRPDAPVLHDFAAGRTPPVLG